MKPETWAQVRELFERVADLPADERASALDEACRDDALIRREVEELIRADSDSKSLTQLAERAVGVASFEERDASALLGLALGGFRLTEVLAAGGMGVVFAAEQETPRRTVAVKLLAGTVPTPSARRRFEYEAEVLALLRHPGIAQVYASGTHRDQVARTELPWIAMELVEGARPVTDYARAEGLDLDARLKLFLGICEAVQHGHSRGVIHRDIKPGNVLVDPEGRPKVIDFGIARAVERQDDRTEDGAIVGTVRYMAPEQLRGEEVDIRCDVYALGVLLYELVCDHAPHDLTGKAAPAAFRLLAEEAPAPPSERRPGVPHDLDWIVLRAMEHERDLRYASVAALEDDLERFRRGEAVLAGPARALYRVQKYVRRHRVGVAALAAIGLLAGAALAIYVAGILRTDREHQKMLRLADKLDLAQLRARAELLYPPDPELIPELQTWLADARRLEPRLADHREVLAELEQRAQASTEGELEFDERGDAWWHQTLSELVADFDLFFGAAQSLPADVERRLEQSRTLGERSVDGFAARAAWDEAIASIADRDACPAYDGLELEPQLGLLPLGRDPDSELWEFLAILSGDPPPRDADGYLVPEEASGVVLVLLPGGRLALRQVDYEAPLDADRDTRQASVEVTPRFLSKWELTQAQWQRLTGAAPSLSAGALLPVERVSWEELNRWLPRIGLALPTDLTWDYGARAGMDRDHWFHRAPADPTRLANVASPQTLPIGSLPPNPFGLHDMLGNVQEWCRDLSEDTGKHVCRGGHFGVQREWFLKLTRAAWREAGAPSERQALRGARAARALDP
ncbi:MAG: bifunctional serine/threonine-protein kinase/formylglycine-generating enzyme family protein [Planctomycetota bacterium]